MSLTKEKRQEIIKGTQMHNKDTGSPEVQIALITERINYLTEHFKTHKKDKHSEYGLKKLVSQRKNLLKYLQDNDPERYRSLIKKLNLRK